MNDATGNFVEGEVLVPVGAGVTTPASVRLGSEIVAMEKLMVAIQAEGWSQALPGLYLEISTPQPSRTNIRGLASEFNSITFDDVCIGNTNNDRADGVSDYPAESLARVEWMKSVTPDMEGGATGGSINLLPRAPSISPNACSRPTSAAPTLTRSKTTIPRAACSPTRPRMCPRVIRSSSPCPPP